jgi:peptidoglycan/xylan/chitin deacetylase (PgdA/CDA1 family)
VRRVVIALVALAAALLGGPEVAAEAATGGAASSPLPIQSASLAQSGKQLTWTVTLKQPFSPSRLARDRRSLCLMLERVQSGSLRGEVCLVGPARRSRTPRVTYSQVVGGRETAPRFVSATVSRSSSRELTATFVPSDVGLAYAPIRWQVVSTLRSAACVPSRGASQCFLLFPRDPALLRIHTPVLAGCVPGGPSWVFHGPTDVREIALTFDDGPWYESPTDNTMQFLRVLEREHVVATFFEVGEHIPQYGEHGAIERRMLADGDMIGDHTWSHADVARGGAFAAAQINDAAAAIRDATGGFEPCLFRAPGGDVSRALLSTASTLGFATIQWNVDPRDWALPGTNAIYDNVVSNARNGAIVIQHDGGGPRSQTLAALPREIETLKARGFKFVTVTDMLGYRLVYR